MGVSAIVRAFPEVLQAGGPSDVCTWQGDEIGRMGYDARRPPHLPKGLILATACRKMGVLC